MFEALRSQHAATLRIVLRRWTAHVGLQRAGEQPLDDSEQVRELQASLDASRKQQVMAEARAKVLEDRLRESRSKLADSKILAGTAEASARLAKQRMNAAMSETKRLRASQAASHDLAR